MRIQKLTVVASNYTAQARLPEKFRQALQEVLDSGGQVVSVTSDTTRLKEAWVIVPERGPNNAPI